jgi:capsule polysaccharide modification protein KpsS
VVIKEHPALVGAVSSSSLGALMRRHDNLVLLDPTINNHEVLQHATAVVTVNSKAGAEALLYGKPVFNLGDSFYRHSGLVVPVSALSELQMSLRSPLMPDDQAVNRFFEDVWQTSSAGELYDASPENLVVFADSIIRGT